MQRLISAFLIVAFAPLAALAGDIKGSADHPAITRYPGSEIAWYKTENYMPYKIAIGPETGYRTIDKWIETQGRVTRIYYTLKGERTQEEVWQNYRDALKSAGFEIVLQAANSKTANVPGGRSWFGTALAPVAPDTRAAAVNEMFAGSATSGGRGVVVAKKKRAEGTLYVVAHVYQYKSDQVSTLIDVIEEKAAESGLVTANADAIGKDMMEFGRVVLDGLYFDHDKATLTAQSKPSLDEIAKFLKAKSNKSFYVVGHTDLVGTYAYNQKLSADRAAAVVDALVSTYGIPRERLEPHGVGPLNPVFTNGTDAGRSKNRRVELVERTGVLAE